MHVAQLSLGDAMPMIGTIDVTMIRQERQIYNVIPMTFYDNTHE